MGRIVAQTVGPFRKIIIGINNAIIVTPDADINDLLGLFFGAVGTAGKDVLYTSFN
jgi:hypothetical protein